MSDDRFIQRDRMRFTRNTLSANLVLLGILFNVFYFINIYKSDIGHNVGNFYYQMRIGISIVYNLIFMLAAFLSSEGVKNYKISYSYVMIALGIIQIIRVFIYPMRAHSAVVTIQDQAVTVMGAGQFARVVLYLLLSAACLFVGAAVGMIRSRALSGHLASLDAKAA